MVRRYAHPSDNHKFEAIKSIEKISPEMYGTIDDRSPAEEAYGTATAPTKDGTTPFQECVPLRELVNS